MEYPEANAFVGHDFVGISFANRKTKDPLGQLVNANNIVWDIKKMALTGYPNHLVAIRRNLAGMVKRQQNW